MNLRGDCSIRIEGLGFTAEEIAACAQKTGLLSIEIRLTGESTCDCTQCRTNPRRGMLRQEILSLVDQAKELGARRVTLIDEPAQCDNRLGPVREASITGRRPVSREDLKSIIAELRTRELEVELIAGEVDADLAGFLINRRVHISVDVEQSGSLEHLKQAGYAGTSAPRLAVRIFASSENAESIPRLWRSARLQNFQPHIQISHPDNSAGSRPLTPAQIRSLFEDLGGIDTNLGIPWDKPPELTGRSCKRHLFAVHAAACGTIYGCVGVTIPIGDIRTEPLREILSLSEVLEDIRAYHQKVKEPCRTCCQTVDCYGCRGSAYQLTGDYLAGDQQCWKADGVPIHVLPVSVHNFVPHGPSMRMVDKIVRLGERRVWLSFTVPADSPFVDENGVLDELAHVEIIAQSFAAAHGLHLTPEELLKHKGMLLGVTNLVVSSSTGAGDKLAIELRKMTRFGDFGIVEGTIRQADGTLIATGQIKIWRPSGEMAAAL